MGNWFSNSNKYSELIQNVSDMDNHLIAYDNRLSICERDVIGFKGKVYEMDKVIKINPVIFENGLNLRNLEERIQNLELKNHKLKESLESVIKVDIDELIMKSIEQIISEKEKWQFGLINEFLTLTDDYDKFKKIFEKEANILHDSGKITDGDITSHYRALCYICHKINSNVLKNYFDSNIYIDYNDKLQKV
jgi:vacuolar-type H+-ATPase subunit I/STV1